MADKKTELMAQFYVECQEKGYTDMTDSVQSLKAKVIATDLKLNYGNIVPFYKKAKDCYEQVQQEKAQAQKQRQLQQQKEEQECIRRRVDGELLVTLSDSSYESEKATLVRVFIRPDNSVYYTINNGSKIEGVPEISIKQGGAVLLTYHPSQAVYTGATVGGITTGGVHHTKAGYTASKTHSGKGDIEISVSGKTFTLQLAKMTGRTCDLFKRDGDFTRFVHNGEIKCYVNSEKANLYYETIKTGRLDHQTMMNALSMAADEQRLSYATCEKIAILLGRIVHGQFPPSDEEIYASAVSLENASTSVKLDHAVVLFNSISHYKDAAKRAKTTKRKYEEVLQKEKEQAIIEKEAKRKKRIKKGIIIFVVLVILASATSTITAQYLNYKSERSNGIRQALLDTYWVSGDGQGLNFTWSEWSVRSGELGCHAHINSGCSYGGFKITSVNDHSASIKLGQELFGKLKLYYELNSNGTYQITKIVLTSGKDCELYAATSEEFLKTENRTS